ncbi:transmembrane protein 74 [Takifugu flavidus]|uniref:transmembrane protein 74 n=1 Tax=Takifugu flavidus TaxID=433684 RepID=UPI0025449E20|nr:transmembrane protein 74 [Takifugu flavidus]
MKHGSVGARLRVTEPKTTYFKFSLSEMSDVWTRIKSGFSLEPRTHPVRFQHSLLLNSTCLAHPELGGRMADVELLYFARPGLGDAPRVPSEERVAEISVGGSPDPCGASPDPCGARPGPYGVSPDPCGARPDPCGARPEKRSAAPPQRETSFTHRDGDGDGQDDLQLTETPQTRALTRSSSGALHEGRELVPEEEEDMPELYLLSDGELAGDGSGKSVDYGFIVAVTCLVTGISLVAISYTVPRDVRVDPDSVSAREMERLEREKARVGSHLDRCVLVGLCLLTLGGALLSTMLMISLWKGEMIRRKTFAYSRHVAELYGSISLAAPECSSTGESCSHLSSDEDLGAFG